MLLHMSCHNDFTFLLRRARDLYIPSRVLTSFSFLLSKSYCSYSIKKKNKSNAPLGFQDIKHLLSSCIRAKICTSVTSFSL